MKLYRKRAFYGLLKAFIYKKLMIFYVRKLSYLIKKESKLFDKYETFKTNISLLDEKRTSVKELSKSSKDIAFL